MYTYRQEVPNYDVTTSLLWIATMQAHNPQGNDFLRDSKLLFRTHIYVYILTTIERPLTSNP